MTKKKHIDDRVRSLQPVAVKEPDYDVAADAEAALKDYGYSLEYAQILTAIFHELRADGAEETATAFKLFRKIAGVVRKPRTKKAA